MSTEGIGVRLPFDTHEALQQIFPPEKSARQGVRDKPCSPNLNDLAADGIDIVLSQEIQALAQELGNSPLAIYFWVRNHIDFVPSYGSIQGAAETLKTRRGNAFDTTSLLISLLKAAQVPSRFGYGTARLKATAVMDWFGVDSPEAALSLLTAGGIPNRAVIQGGSISEIDIETIWCEAWVDYIPSRGAKHRVGDSWIMLLEYLPTDSPDLNPIEHKWAQVKAIRRQKRCSVEELFARYIS
jgi:hypothetical protein